MIKGTPFQKCGFFKKTGFLFTSLSIIGKTGDRKKKGEKTGDYYQLLRWSAGYLSAHAHQDLYDSTETRYCQNRYVVLSIIHYVLILYVYLTINIYNYIYYLSNISVYPINLSSFPSSFLLIIYRSTYPFIYRHIYLLCI